MSRDVPSSGSAADDRSVVEAVERLDQEFRGAVRRRVIVRVVRRSREELQSPSPAAMPELVERLARQRLLQHARRAERPERPERPERSATHRGPGR